MALDYALIAGFLRTLGMVAPLVGQPGVTAIANFAATLLETGADSVQRFQALTKAMKDRADAGIATTPQEIIDDVDRIVALDKQIQDA
jgi:hypothetical protein